MNDSKQPTKRLESIDLLKGLIITIIVFVHMMFMIPSEDKGDGIALLFQIMYLGR